MYSQGSGDGWWFCPYGCDSGGSVGLSEETILRNTLGLKNTVASLLEARSGGGPRGRTSPGRRRTAGERRTRRSTRTRSSSTGTSRTARPSPKAISDAIAFQTSNTGRIVFRGAREIEAHPAPHPGSNPPPRQEPGPDQILETPPCGYLLTTEQYRGARTDGPAGRSRPSSSGWTRTASRWKTVLTATWCVSRNRSGG